jgi:hypothetical protein
MAHRATGTVAAVAAGFGCAQRKPGGSSKGADPGRRTPRTLSRAVRSDPPKEWVDLDEFKCPLQTPGLPASALPTNRSEVGWSLQWNRGVGERQWSPK